MDYFYKIILVNDNYIIYQKVMYSLVKMYTIH